MKIEDELRLRAGQKIGQTKKYWFKPKPYGWGATPTTLEGWGLTMLFSALLLGLVWWNGLMQEVEPVPIKNIWLFIFEIGMLSFGFMHFIKDRVEGGLKWRWGLKKEKSQK